MRELVSLLLDYKAGSMAEGQNLLTKKFSLQFSFSYETFFIHNMCYNLFPRGQCCIICLLDIFFWHEIITFALLTSGTRIS